MYHYKKKRDNQIPEMHTHFTYVEKRKNRFLTHKCYVIQDGIQNHKLTRLLEYPYKSVARQALTMLEATKRVYNVLVWFCFVFFIRSIVWLSFSFVSFTSVYLCTIFLLEFKNSLHQNIEGFFSVSFLSVMKLVLGFMWERTLLGQIRQFKEWRWLGH